MEVARLDAFTDDDGGEGAAGAGTAPVWVKYADGAVDEVEREVRATSRASAAACNAASGRLAHATLRLRCAPRARLRSSRQSCASLCYSTAPAPRTRRRCSFRSRWVLRASVSRWAARETLRPTAQVGPEVLNLIIDYCRFHRAAGRSDKVRHAACTQRLYHR